MKRLIPCILAVGLLLSGCSQILDGNYHNVTPHEVQSNQTESQIAAVSNFAGLCQTLADMVESGTENGIISVSRYDQELVEQDMDAAVADLMQTNPICAYAVEQIQYELGANAGQPAIAVSITYLHSRAEILKIRHLDSLEQVELAMAEALDDCDSGLVLHVEVYEEIDFDQWVSDYAVEHPDRVMEVPQVTANLYPEEGEKRVVELKFTYQNSRDALREMQGKVEPLFNAAVIYAGEDADQAERYFKLYSFLMGLSQNFQLETSITPAYSLLQHGVGDSKAFATVYAAMCEEAELECILVTGTKSGEPWYWNIICCDGVYYHVDLWECDEQDRFLTKTDDEMSGYVWDRDAHPACGIVPETEE